jgi:hypothetical protein
VVILDEVQALPPGLLEPTIDAGDLPSGVTFHEVL